MNQKGETVSFRLEAGLKAAFTAIAEAEAKPVGELLRELIRLRVEQQQRRQFLAEARRQSMEAAAAARNADSDEAKAMQELEADLEAFPAEWR